MLMPGRDIPYVDTSLPIDKIAHWGVFMILALLMIFGFYNQYSFQGLKKYALALTLISSGSYGITTEFIQTLSTERSFDVYDIIANEIGCTTGAFLFQFSGRRIPLVGGYLEKYFFNYKKNNPS